MSEERGKTNYTVACVSEFAKKYGLNLTESFQFLFQYKAIEFLKENYDIEHTLSLDDALEDMMTICQKNGGTLATVVNKMIFKKTTSQYSFHTEKAIRLLKKAGIL